MTTKAGPNEQTRKLAGLIKDIRIAMLTTAMPDGTLRSRPMATQQVEPDGDLWFFTQTSAAKAEEIRANPHVNVSYADPRENRYVSVSGTAAVVRDRGKIEELWDLLYKAWFPHGLEDPDLALLRVNVERAEYWDTPSGTMVEIAGFVKAVATGRPVNIGENEKVEFQAGRE